MHAQPPEADAPLSFSERYWMIALPVWLIASGICAVVAVASPTWSVEEYRRRRQALDAHPAE